MHISFVTETYPPEVNGVAMTLSNVIKELWRKGHTISIIRPRQSSDFGSDAVSEHSELLVTSGKIPGYGSLQFGICRISTIRSFWKKNKPNHIYIATEGPLGCIALLASKQLKIPTSSGFHTNFHQYLKHYSVPFLKGVMECYLKKFHNSTSKTFVPSQSLLESLQLLEYKNLAIMGRGIDTGLFSPTKRSKNLRLEWGCGENDIVLLYAGRVASEKNIPLAIKTYRDLKTLGFSLKFVIVGDGPALKALRNEHPDVIFSGMQKGEALARHYASADFFIFPSITETYGNVVPEAMASGLVTVAYDYAAPKQLIKHGENGFIAKLNDDQEFIRIAKEALLQIERASKIKEAARNTALSFSWDEVSSRFLNELLV